MKSEFSLNNQELRIFVSKYKLYARTVFKLFFVFSFTLLVIGIGVFENHWFLLASPVCIFFVWLILVDLLRKRNNVKTLETVDIIRIDRSGIFKTGRDDANPYHFSWSDFSEIVRADNLHQIELDTRPDQSSIYLKSHAKDVILIIFNEGSVDILERSNLDLGVTTKSLDYICLEVPNHQLDATEHALKRFTAGKVRIRRFSQVKFDFRNYKEKYIV